MGRKPFTPGEKITVDYLAGELKRIGFEPAFDGSYFQPVPMVEISSEVKGPAKIMTGKKEIISSMLLMILLLPHQRLRMK